MCKRHDMQRRAIHAASERYDSVRLVYELRDNIRDLVGLVGTKGRSAELCDVHRMGDFEPFRTIPVYQMGTRRIAREFGLQGCYELAWA